MSAETETLLTNYIVQNILKQPKYNLDPDAKLITTGLIDSLSIVDLAIFIEDRFGVKIKASDLNAETFDTLNDLVRLIETRRNGSAGHP